MNYFDAPVKETGTVIQTTHLPKNLQPFAPASRKNPVCFIVVAKNKRPHSCCFTGNDGMHRQKLVPLPRKPFSFWN
jgi:hypothetical protein